MTGIQATNFKKHAARHYGFNKREIVIAKNGGNGIYVKTTDGEVLRDLVAGYGSNGFGNCYPPLHEAMINALAIDADGWGIPGTNPNAIPVEQQTDFLPRICKLLGYDKALPMNSGAEAVETAIKLARKWGYSKKGISRKDGEIAEIIVCDGNFHGRTTTIVGFSSEPTYKDPFAPATPGFMHHVPFGDSDALRRMLKKHHRNVAAFLFEPIQGEGGVNFPPDGYLQKVRDLCNQYKVLMIADEIQTGLARTGKMLACDHEGVRPDIVLLAKLLGGGKLPTSCVLADDCHMVFEPGEHGSTYAGNPFAMTVANAVLDILVRERFCERSADVGAYLLEQLSEKLLPRFVDLIKNIRGRGLMLAIEPHDAKSTGAVIEAFLDQGLLAKDAHGVIRISPPLIITKKECDDVVRRIVSAFHTIQANKKAAA